MSSTQERVVHILDPTASSHIPLFLPRVRVTRGGGGGDVDSDDDGDGGGTGGGRDRPFSGDGTDVDRVMDYPNMPDPPDECLVMHCEAPGSGIDDPDVEGKEEEYDGGIVFPRRSARLSGGYIFLSRPRDDDGGGGSGKTAAEEAAAKAEKKGNNGGERSDDDGRGPRKIACIPLHGCRVESPPGGRRVFREHAHTGARRGYEMSITVKSGETCYVVLDNLGLRNAWSAAIERRNDVGNKKFTLLRPGGIAAARLMSADEEAAGLSSGGAVWGKRALSERGQHGQQQQLLKMPPSSMKQRGAAGQGGKGPRKSYADMIGMDRRAAFSKGQIGGSNPRGSTRSLEMSTDLDRAIEQFGVHGFDEERWVHDFLAKHAVDELTRECDTLDSWMDEVKNGLRNSVLEQYEYFVEASREMSTMGREVAWIRTLVERQQETLMTLRNIDFGAGFDDAEDGGQGDDNEYDGGYLSDTAGVDDPLLDGTGSDASSVASSDSSDDGSNPRTSSSRTPMRTNARNRRRESRPKAAGGSAPLAPVSEPDDALAGAGEGQSSHHVEIPPWMSDAAEEVSAFIKESRYSDATDLILKARREASDILAAHEQPMSSIVTSPKTSNVSSTAPIGGGGNNIGSASHQKTLTRKQQSLLQRTNVQLDALMERLAKRLAENLRRKNEALKASAKRERADPLSNLAPLVSPVCLNDDAVALHLLVRLGRYQEAATAYAARRSLLLSECLHERPISSPVGMDAVIYAAQLSSSFFSSLAVAVEGFLDLFDSNTENSNDDDTSLNSRSLTLGGGGKRIPSGALSAVVLWCDSELAKFTNVFGSSRLLGGLALSPPGIRRHENKEGAKVSLAKEREHSIEVAAKCVNQAFTFASENLDLIGLPLTPKLAENIRPKLRGCEADVAALLDSRWKALAFEWTVERSIPSRPAAAPRSITDDDRRV